MEFQDILYEVSEGIATITLNRPDNLNAFTGRMMHEIISALDITDADDDVKVVIFTGAGRAYCAGADLSSGGETFAKGAVRAAKWLKTSGPGLFDMQDVLGLK